MFRIVQNFFAGTSTAERPPSSLPGRGSRIGSTVVAVVDAVNEVGWVGWQAHQVALIPGHK